MITLQNDSFPHTLHPSLPQLERLTRRKYVLHVGGVMDGIPASGVEIQEVDVLVEQNLVQHVVLESWRSLSHLHWGILLGHYNLTLKNR